MKTIFVTLVSGIFISLITSIGLDTELENHTEKSEIITETNYCVFCGEEDICTIECQIESLEFELFSNIQEEDTIEPKDIIVYEIEEEVELGFNTKDYLPTDFNKYAGMNSTQELEVEAELVLTTMFNDIEQDNIVKVEDVLVYELEEEIEFGFNTKNFLPTNFNPYKGMNLSIELLKEEKLALKTIINKIEFEKIISIEDVVVFELEEEVEIPLISTYLNL